MRQLTLSHAFSLVEILFVVVILGLLALLALPAFQKARFQARVSLLSNDLRLFHDAFQIFLLEKNQLPPSYPPRILPPEMKGYIKPSDFAAPNPVGGYYKWENFGSIAGIGFTAAEHFFAVVQEVDFNLDDGDFDQGRLVYFNSGNSVEEPSSSFNGNNGPPGGHPPGGGPPSGFMPPGLGVGEDGAASQTAKDRLAEIFGNRQGPGWESGNDNNSTESYSSGSLPSTDQFLFMVKD